MIAQQANSPQHQSSSSEHSDLRAEAGLVESGDCLDGRAFAGLCRFWLVSFVDCISSKYSPCYL